MHSITSRSQYVCARCLQRRQRRLFEAQHAIRGSKFFSTLNGGSQAPSGTNAAVAAHAQDEEVATNVEKGHGAMSRRLEDLTEQSIQTGGRSAQKSVEEAGFSEELKRKIEAKLQESKFRSEHPAAFATLDMPSSAGEGTRNVAAAQPWRGSEQLGDAALRMLNDAHKPLRRSGRPAIPIPRGSTATVDMRMKKAAQKSTAERLANARDRTSIYTLTQDPNMTASEREQMRQELKERFTPGARLMPASVQGLAALANERIEDAIARGQFKNIPRGKGKNIERDHNADSPFIDTTEYLMNKMIQKQDIVPPWIEKQQEVVRTAAAFRSRLRADWKRHAARVIASKGGSLEEQVRKAEAYAAAELALNPAKPKTESLTAISEEGRISEVTITETSATNSKVTSSKIQITTSKAGSPVLPPVTTNLSSPQPSPITKPLHLPPFRDRSWLALESAYHNLVLSSLNSLTRSYNLMAPALAQKPYFNLERELKACYADVAPHLAAEIRERARTPERIRVEKSGHKKGGLLEKFKVGDEVRVWEDRRKRYGWGEFWRDLWN